MRRKHQPKRRDPHEIAVALALLIEALTDEEFCHELATDIAAVGSMFNQSLLAISGKEQAQANDPGPALSPLALPRYEKPERQARTYSLEEFGALTEEEKARIKPSQIRMSE